MSLSSKVLGERRLAYKSENHTLSSSFRRKSSSERSEEIILWGKKRVEFEDEVRFSRTEERVPRKTPVRTAKGKRFTGT